MADTKALADIIADGVVPLSGANLGDYIFVERAGVPYPITYDNLMDNSYTFSNTLTLTGSMSFTAGTVTFANNQIGGLKVAAATRTSRGTMELATPAEAEASTDDARAVTPLGAKSVITKYVKGYSQEWTNPTRLVNTSYTNSTSRPIEVAITVSGAAPIAFMQVQKPGEAWVTVGRSGSQAAAGTCTFTVPPTHLYRVAGAVPIDIWAELR